MAENRAQEYTAKLDELVRRAIVLPADARKEVLDQLRQAAEEVTRVLATAEPDSLNAARLRALRVEVQRVMDSFAQRASAETNKVQATMYRETSQDTTAAIRIVTNTVAVQPVIDTHVLAIAQGYTADLIGGLATDTAQKVNNALRRATLIEGYSRRQLVEQIGGALEGGEFSGLFSPAGARAESIVTNETLRMHSLASMARLRSLASRHDGIEKEWLHVPAAKVPRPLHILASGQTRPVDQPFDVGGEKLMYPRDPSGRADNTISCHCLVRPKVNPALLQPSDRERAPRHFDHHNPELGGSTHNG